MNQWIEYGLSFDEWIKLSDIQRLFLAIDNMPPAELYEITDEQNWPSVEGTDVRIILTDELIEQLKQGKRFGGWGVYLEYEANDPA